MAILLDVTLISGRRVSVEADQNASVELLQQRVCTALGVGRGRLLDSFGSVLDGEATVATAGLRTGDCLTLQINNVQICATKLWSFAAVLGDGSVAAWGNAYRGGDSTAVQYQLKNAQQIQATNAAFAAKSSGGDSSAVQGQLKNAQQIQATNAAFAAILGDGSVIPWAMHALVATVVRCRAS